VGLYPEARDKLSPEIVALILGDIDHGMPDGQRYSNYPAARKRPAWPVVREHCPTRTESQCRAIIAAWIKQGVLYEDDYHDQSSRKKQSGLFVRKPATQEAA
jgi:hypothetical protein